MKSPWRYLFLLDVLVHLAGIISSQSLLILFSKPLLMPLLAAWLMAETKSNSGPFRIAIIFALAFSTLGDVMLMFEGGLFFLAGLGAFLIAHLWYIRAFTSIKGLRSGYFRKNTQVLLPFIAYPALLLWYLWNGIPPDMKIPVCTYAGVITLMVLCAMNLKGSIPPSVFVALLTGAFLFVVSDSIIAVGRFGPTYQGSRLAVMLTYITGQYLLILSAIKWLNKPAIAVQT